ncbi:MAG: hypothetical protein WC661_17090 [Opitutaceae bacterium]|jgi:hypothetical protein
MPSPREILIARHREHEPRLDSLRAAVLAEACSQAKTSAGARHGIGPRVFLRALWRELFVPCRLAWGAFAGVWLLLLALNAADRSATEAIRPSVAEAAAVLACWREERRALAEWDPPVAPTHLPASSARRPREQSWRGPASAAAERAC